jgi:hypothetical protein
MASEYLPQAYSHTPLLDLGLGNLTTGTKAPGIVRKVRCLKVLPDRNSGDLLLTLEGLPDSLRVDGQAAMKLGSETVSIREYFVRVLEAGDLIDVVVEPGTPPRIPYLWIHIEYFGKPTEGRSFSRKDDGLFALRTKAGEKAERRVARHLATNFGHIYRETDLIGPGCFQIYYAGKGIRKPDRVCERCGLRIEVKKRNKDSFYRVSHSQQRPFQSENSSDGWHCFVFQDYSFHFLANSAISAAIEAGQFTEGSDRYDKWIDLDATRVRESAPPVCSDV